ncbi:hypothetical protein XI01_31300 [Bradyrhizobium sp. CCBAU 21360]|nr:hypothetical protein [Bradyrhizobium sp. CCBAU 21360]
MVAPAPSELVGVAETARARLIHALLARHESYGLVDVFAGVMVLSEVAQRLMMSPGRTPQRLQRSTVKPPPAE